MSSPDLQFKYIVVGAGFFGATMAERIATLLNEKVLVLEKRDHIGGNSFSEYDLVSGIEVHKYGSHIFHTSNKKVWDYINEFTTFNHYRHKVFTKYKNSVYQMPINLSTINNFYGINLTPSEVQFFLAGEIGKEKNVSPKNLEEKAISLIGRPLYNAFIKGYTLKQWAKDPKELPPSIITRLPVRSNYHADYFDDPYQGIPFEGYTALFNKMLAHKNIEVRLNTDYFDVEKEIPKKTFIIYSGPIDRFFNYKFGLLNWRTLTFEKEVFQTLDYQGTAVMNYADEDIPFIRIHEFKHYHPERESKKQSVIFREYSKSATKGEDPYYPINTDKDKDMVNLYLNEAKKMSQFIFGGRLGTYRYINMDEAIENALSLFDERFNFGNT